MVLVYEIQEARENIIFPLVTVNHWSDIMVVSSTQKNLYVFYGCWTTGRAGIELVNNTGVIY
jgi:hypothetical protein